MGSLKVKGKKAKSIQTAKGIQTDRQSGPMAKSKWEKYYNKYYLCKAVFLSFTTRKKDYIRE